MTTPVREIAPMTYQGLGPGTGQQLIPAGSGTVDVYNGDIGNVLLLSPDRSPQLSNSIPVQPLTNAKIDASKRTYYGSALSGSIAAVTVSAAELSPSPAQIAAQIALAGVGVIPVDNELVNATVGGTGQVSIASGASSQVYAGIPNAISYKMSISVLNGGAPTNPFCKVSFIWKDAPGGNVLMIQQWIVMTTNAAPANANTLVGGRGPTEAPFLQVLVKNYDGTAVTVDFTLTGSSRLITRHDWRSVSNNITGTYTLGSIVASTPQSAPAVMYLGGSSGISVGASSSQYRLNALYTGSCQLVITALPAAAYDITVNLSGIDSDLLFPLSDMNVFEKEYAGPVPGSGFVALEQSLIALPRAPTIIRLSNNTSTAITIGYTLLGQEFAS